MKKSCIEKSALGVSRNTSFRPRKGVLVLNHHGLGNVIMSLPLMQALSYACEDGTSLYVLLSSKGHYEPLAGNELRITPLFLHPDYEGALGLLRMARDLRGKVDMVVAVPQVPAKLAIAIKLLIGAKYTVAEAFQFWRLLLTYSVAKTWTGSILDAQLGLLERMSIRPVERAPKLVLSGEERAFALTVLPDEQYLVVAIHPSAGEESKRWPADRFGRVIADLSERYPDALFVLIGGKNEVGDAEIASRAAPRAKIINGVGKWRFRETAAVLSRVDLVISGDTGMMHLGAAVGARTLSIFGPTSASRLAPDYNGGGAVVPIKPCHPCFRDRFAPCSCIREIDPDRVVDFATQMIDKQNNSSPRTPEILS